jgi:hypothetical protein
VICFNERKKKRGKQGEKSDFSLSREDSHGNMAIGLRVHYNELHHLGIQVFSNL